MGNRNLPRNHVNLSLSRGTPHGGHIAPWCTLSTHSNGHGFPENPPLQHGETRIPDAPSPHMARRPPRIIPERTSRYPEVPDPVAVDAPRAPSSSSGLTAPRTPKRPPTMRPRPASRAKPAPMRTALLVYRLAGDMGELRIWHRIPPHPRPPHTCQRDGCGDSSTAASVTSFSDAYTPRSLTLWGGVSSLSTIRIKVYTILCRVPILARSGGSLSTVARLSPSS